MKKIKILALILSVLLCIGLLSGCGAASDSYVDGDYGNLKNESIMDNATPMEPGDIEMGTSSDSINNANGSSGSTDGSESDNSLKKQKIIQTFYYDVESTDFDKSVEELEKAIKESDGYIESSNVSGNKYYYKNTRIAEYTIRIPTKNANKFVEYIDGNCIVSRKEIDTEDVTTKYVDIQSRLSALRSEKAVLEKLLTQATNMSDVLAIQKQLTNVIYEIESYESRLRTYDNLIDYTTVHLTIDEVETPTVVEEKTMWQEIKDKFGDNLDDVIEGLKNFVIFMVSSIPQFVIIFIIVFPTILIIKKCNKKRRAKKMIKKQQMAQQMAQQMHVPVMPPFNNGPFVNMPPQVQVQTPVNQDTAIADEKNNEVIESNDENKPE